MILLGMLFIFSSFFFNFLYYSYNYLVLLLCVLENYWKFISGFELSIGMVDLGCYSFKLDIFLILLLLLKLIKIIDFIITFGKLL